MTSFTINPGICNDSNIFAKNFPDTCLSSIPKRSPLMQVPNPSAPRREKIVLVGPPSSGKTSIANRAVQQIFTGNSESTVGAAFLSKVFTVDGTTVKLDIWDTGGAEKYRSLAPMYYRDARVAIIVFDVSQPSSLAEATSWLRDVRQHGRSDVVLVGAANKIDLAEQRKVSANDVEEWQYSNSLELVVETSAKTGVGVARLFEEVCRIILRLQPTETSGGCDVFISDDPSQVAGSGGCPC